MATPDVDPAPKWAKPDHLVPGHDEFPIDIIDDTVADPEKPVQENRVTLTEEDNRRICRKTDWHILTILVWVYFLQILDKSILGVAAVFDLKTDLNLSGAQYSLAGSIAPIAQLAWQPFSSVLIVKVPPRILMPVMLFGWSLAQTLTVAASSFSGLMACRFFLGLFEAGCLPLFSVMTATWYRRSEQPLRIAAWYGTNGLATIFASGVSYGLANIKSNVLAEWQMIFLFTGLLSLASVPFVYWFLDNEPATARFLTPEERLMAVERLRANQGGAISDKMQWNQVLEAFTDLKMYLSFYMAFGNNVGAQVVNVFGPLILAGIGFDKYETVLLNMPLGALQWLIILAVAYATVKVRFKSLTLGIILIPIIVGSAVLYALPRTPNHNGGLLASYYLLAFAQGCNTLIVSWMLANVAGQTKKSVTMSLYNAASSAGQIVGPQLFTSKDEPRYLPGLRAVMAVYAAIFATVLLQVVNLTILNKSQEKRRVQNGKPAKIKDHSMEARYTDMGDDVGDNAFKDITDRQNDEFVYVL